MSDAQLGRPQAVARAASEPKRLGALPPPPSLFQESPCYIPEVESAASVMESSRGQVRLRLDTFWLINCLTLPAPCLMVHEASWLEAQRFVGVCSY